MSLTNLMQKLVLYQMGYKNTWHFCKKNLVLLIVCRLWIQTLINLLKNLSDEDFKYLVEEINSKNLELLKQKDAYSYEYMNSFKRFNEEKIAW